MCNVKRPKRFQQGAGLLLISICVYGQVWLSGPISHSETNHAIALVKERRAGGVDRGGSSA